MIKISLSEEATLILKSTQKWQFSHYTVHSHVYHGMQHTKKENFPTVQYVLMLRQNDCVVPGTFTSNKTLSPSDRESGIKFSSIWHPVLFHNWITPSLAGQPYILATLPPFAANILFLLQSMSAEIILCIKGLNTLINANVETREAEDIEGTSEDGLDEEDRDN